MLKRKKMIKKFVAIINQVGEDNPTVVILENTLGINPFFQREQSGLYAVYDMTR